MTYKKRAAGVALFLALLMMLVGTGGSVAQSSPTEAVSKTAALNPVVRTSVITDVLPRLSWRVVAVAIEYADPLPGGLTITPSAFEVNARILGATAPRTVTRVYTSEVAAVGRPSGRSSGNYLIVELDPSDPNAPTTTDAVAGDPTSTSDPIPLERAYTVQQVAAIVSSQGRVIVEAEPFALQNDDVINTVVDEFAARSFLASNGLRMSFRAFRPQEHLQRQGRNRRYPLVITLHGGGEYGLNNVTQLTANRIAYTFAKPERQRSDPAFVLSPQIPAPRPVSPEGDGLDWTEPRVHAALLQLIDAYVARRPIDPDRIYLVGLSSGARGVFEVLSKSPGKYAGALVSAGWNRIENVVKITDTPIWATHSIDDPVVPCVAGRFGQRGTCALMDALEDAGVGVTRGEWPADLSTTEFDARARTLLRQSRREGNHVLFTLFPSGTTPVHPHVSWGPVHESDVMIDWLFDQSR